MGYDIEQVDLFLDDVIDRFEQYESERREMLIAMEYLLQKREKEQEASIREMRKAIDTGKPQKKRASSKDRDSKERGEESADSFDEVSRAARSIARGAQAPKPVRAPKINRVRPGQGAKNAPVGAEAAAEPKTEQASPERERKGITMENWLDELLANLIEREKVGYGEPLESAGDAACDNGDAAPADETTGQDEMESPDESDPRE